MTFSQILAEFLEEDTKAAQSSSEKGNFPSEIETETTYTSLFVAQLDSGAIASRRYGLKAKSRFERKVRPSQPITYLFREFLNQEELAALRFLLGPERISTADGAIADSDIRRLYRHRALELHPDRAGGSASLFQELRQHYEVLSEALRRAKIKVA